MGLKPSRRYAHLWQTLGGKMSERTRDLGVRIGVVLFLLFAVGACASDGDSSSTSARSKHSAGGSSCASSGISRRVAAENPSAT